MKNRAASTLGFRARLLSGFLLLLSVAVGAVSFRNSQSLTRSLADVGKPQMAAVRNMSLADMMHDGIRASVYWLLEAKIL